MQLPHHLQLIFVFSSLGAKIPQSKPESTADPEVEPEISPSEPDPGDDTIDPSKETKVGGVGLLWFIL